MGVLCLARGALTLAGAFTGRYVSVTLLSGASAPVGTRVRKYSQAASHGGDVASRFVCHHLPHRTLLKIQGQDTSAFLQGIITNDMDLLEEPGRAAMYSHMLNVQGRTLYDIMLYRYRTFATFVMLTWAFLFLISEHEGVTSYLSAQLPLCISGNACPQFRLRVETSCRFNAVYQYHRFL